MATRIITFQDTSNPANGNSFLPTDFGGGFAIGGGRAFDTSGNLIVFASDAFNLGSTNDLSGITTDVYLYNQSGNTFTNLTHRDENGNTTNEPSRNPAISGNGLKVVFESREGSLDKDAASGATSDIFWAENLTSMPPTITLLTNGYTRPSFNPSISEDGNWFVYETEDSFHTNVFDGPDFDRDIILRNPSTAEVFWVSDVSGMGNIDPVSIADSTNASVSRNGEYVVFQSNIPANELVPGSTDGNVGSDIFLFRKSDQTLRLISNTGSFTGGAANTSGNSGSFNSMISADGEYIVYNSFASNLVDGDSNFSSDIFRYHIDSGATTRLSLRPDGSETNANSLLPAIDTDANRVAFVSFDNDLVTPDTDNGNGDIFLWEEGSGITRVSENAGIGGNRDSGNPGISPDGTQVAFESTSDNLGSPVAPAGTTNNIFVDDGRGTIPPLKLMGGTAQIAFVAYYGRPADSAGAPFWNNFLTTNGISYSPRGGDPLTGPEIPAYQQFVDAFGIPQPEANRLYGGLSTSDQVNQVYNFAFNRNAEPAGLNFWRDNIDNGRVNLAEFALEIALGAQDNDIVVLSNKIASADLFSQSLNTPAEIAGYSGSTGELFGRNWLAGFGATVSTQAQVDAALLAEYG